MSSAACAAKWKDLQRRGAGSGERQEPHGLRDCDTGPIKPWRRYGYVGILKETEGELRSRALNGETDART